MEPQSFKLTPSKYSSAIGYSELEAQISAQPTGRFFDIQYFTLPVFEGEALRQFRISRHSTVPDNTRISLGRITMQTHHSEVLHTFSFGGRLHTTLAGDFLHCHLESPAPILKVQDEFEDTGSILVDEILDALAENQARCQINETELYHRLSRYEPYELFLSSLVTIQARIDATPAHAHTEEYRKLASALRHTIQTVIEIDHWTGTAKSLEEIIAQG